MAGKVNTKFILIVGAVVAVVTIAAAYVAVESVRKTGDDYIELGDKALAEKKVNEAIALYGKAVYKDQRNPAWLKKWVGAMEQEIPANRNAYQDRYLKEYSGGLQRLAEAQPSDYEAHRRWLQERWAMLNAFGTPKLRDLEPFIPFVEQTVKGFTGSEEDRKRLMRYRGLASLGLLTIKTDMKEDELLKIRADLEGALSVDPADTEVAIALGQIDWARSIRAFERDDKPEVARLNAELLAFIAKHIKEHPPAADMRRFELRTLVQMATQGATEKVTYRDVLQDRQERVEEMAQAYLKEKPEDLSASTLPEAIFFVRIVLPKERSETLVNELMNHALKARGDDPSFLLLAAQNQLDEGKMQEAIATLDTMIALPDRPMSLDGLLLYDYRALATRVQFEAAFSLWETTEKDLEKKAAAAQRAREFRQRYLERLPQGASDTRLQPIDAKLALIDGDIRGATTLLDRYNKDTAETDPETMFLMAVLLRQQSNDGAARAAFERVLQIADEQRYMRQRMGSIVQLAQIAEKNSDRAELLKWLRIAQRYQPENQELANQIAVLETLIAQQANPELKATGEQADRVEAQKLLEKAQAEVSGVGADPLKAETTLRDAMKKPAFAADFRFHKALITILAGTGRTDDALAAVDAALVKFPEGQQAKDLQGFRESLTRADPVADMLAKIDAATLTPLQKRLARYDLYRRANKPAEATAELAEAAKLAPEDAVVVDAQFEEALAARNMTEMERLTKLAEEKNLDQAKGRLFRARVLMVEGKYADAATLLRGVVEGDRFNALAWRLLGYCYAAEGEVQRKAGDLTKYREEYGRAAEAFTRAYEIKNSDVLTINGYIQSLAVTQRPAEALAIARKAETVPVVANNPDFVETLIKLESAAPGGNRERAIELRQNLAKDRPDIAENQGELAVLLMQKRRWDDAKAIIEKLRESPDHKGLVTSLEVRWLVLQDKFTEAEKLITDYIAAQPTAERNEGPYLAASKLFKEVNRPDLAIAFLEKGRDLQDKKQMVIDRELGDTYFNMRGPRDDARGNTQKAADAYTRVLDAGSEDRDDAVAKRLLECYLMLGNWTAFDDMIKSLGDRAQKDSTLLVLAADAAAAQGDTAKALRIYDQAVASDSTNQLVFLKRGDYYAQFPDKERDAIADLEQAARLAPNSTQALIRLTDLHLRAKRPEEAAKQAARAVAVAPGDDNLRMRTIQLRLSMGDADGAFDLVEQAIQLQPESVEWLIKGGQIALDQNKQDRALGYLRTAWEREKSNRTAIPYVTVLLEKTPPDVAAAESVVNDKTILEKAQEEKGQTLLAYRLMRALALVRSKNPALAENEVSLGLAAMDQSDPRQAELLMGGLESVFMEIPKQIEVLDRVAAKTPLTGYVKIQSLMLRMRQESTRDQAARDLTALADATEDTNVKFAVYKLLGSFHFQVNQPAASVAAYQKALAIAPNDLEALNNAAYIMATKTGQASEARLLADRALELAPESATVLDTVAMVYHELKDAPKATELYTRALQKSKSDNERAPVLLHLAKVLIEQGQKSQAETHLTAARRMLTDNPQLEQQFGAELKDLLRQIDGQ